MLRDSNTAKHDQHLWPCLSFLSGVVDTAVHPPPHTVLEGRFATCRLIGRSSPF